MTKFMLVIIAVFGCLWCALLFFATLVLLSAWWFGTSLTSVSSDGVVLVFMFAVLLAPPGLGVAFLAIRDLRRESRSETRGFEPVLPVRTWPPEPHPANRVIPIPGPGSTVARTILLSIGAALGYLWFGYFVAMAVVVTAFRRFFDEPNFSMMIVFALILSAFLLLLGIPGLMIARAAVRSLRDTDAAQPRGFEPIVKGPEGSEKQPDADDRSGGSEPHP